MLGRWRDWKKEDICLVRPQTKKKKKKKTSTNTFFFKPRKKKQCVICLRCRGGDGRTSYHCSAECLRAHWPFHKELHEAKAARAANGKIEKDFGVSVFRFSFFFEAAATPLSSSLLTPFELRFFSSLSPSAPKKKKKHPKTLKQTGTTPRKAPCPPPRPSPSGEASAASSEEEEEEEEGAPAAAPTSSSCSR